MTEVVINNKFGGFGISDEAAEWLIEERGWTVTQYRDGYAADEDADLIDRTAGPEGKDWAIGQRYVPTAGRSDPDFRADEDLVAVVKELGADANGDHADLKVVDVPDDVEWKIEEYDGNEWVAEKHRTWS